MADVPGNSTTDKTITIGSTIGGDLETIGDHDWYRVQFTAGQSYTVLLTGVTLEDPYLRIRDSAGNLLFERDDISPGVIRDSKISFVAPTSGTYYIDVGSWEDGSTGGYTGTYQLSVQPYTPPPEYSLDQVADFLTSGYWAGDSHRFDVTQGGSLTVNITALTAAGQSLARLALGAWSEIIGIKFVEVSTGGQIVFDDNEQGAFADGVWADGIITSANVNVSTQWLAQYGTSVGGYSYQTYIHEIGHALGLGHAGYYNGSGEYFSDAVFSNDGWPSTVMSYFDQGDSDFFDSQGFLRAYVATPMIADITAMQMLYGLSTTTRAGDTIYGYSSNAGSLYNPASYPDTAYTIFDSGGVDTLDYSQTIWNTLINLTPGSFSNINSAIGTVAIAPGVIIENATAGRGDDVIIANGANNRLDGGEGADTISYQGATAGVTVNLSLSVAQNTGGSGTDTLLNFETLVGSDFDDVLTARPSSTVRAGDGDDVLIGGGSGWSLLEGEGGDDTFISRPGEDRFEGGEGFDTVDYSGAASAIGVHGSATEGEDILISIEAIIGSRFDDTIWGGLHLSGGDGNDFLWAQHGLAVLTGGNGSDTFSDSASGFDGDVITDFTIGDRLIITDAQLDSFEFSLSGSTLTYSGGTLTLQGIVGTLYAEPAQNYGVQLTLREGPPPITRAKLILTESGQDFTVGGTVAVFGTASGGEVIEVVNGNITLDASFNSGGDTVVLPGDAGSYTAVLSGSFVTISDGGLSVAIPVGTAGIAVQFANSTRTLQIEDGKVVLGTQQITAAPQPVAASGAPLSDAVETGPDSFGRLILTVPGQDVDIGGNVSIVGTASHNEVITVLDGEVRLDASFNLGGDTVVLPGAAGSYSASLSGSLVTLTDGDLSVVIPVGGALTVEFGDADRTLRIDTITGYVMLGSQVVTASSQPVTAGVLAMQGLFEKAEADLVEVTSETFEVSLVTLEVDSFSFG